MMLSAPLTRGPPTTKGVVVEGEVEEEDALALMAVAVTVARIAEAVVAPPRQGSREEAMLALNWSVEKWPELGSFKL